MHSLLAQAANDGLGHTVVRLRRGPEHFAQRQAVTQFDAEVEVSRDGMTVGGASIMGLMMLAAAPGCSIRVAATGPQRGEVLDALQALIADRFGEEI